MDDMLAVGPSEITKRLLEALAKDMTMRWGMVTDKPQKFLGRSLCRTVQGYRFGVSHEYVTQMCEDFGFGNLKGSSTLTFVKAAENDTILDESRQRRSQTIAQGDYSGWIVLTSKTQCVKLSTHVGIATTCDEVNIKRLLRYLIGNPACNMISCCYSGCSWNCGHSARFLFW